MAGQATYENINAAVRPPRCAILIGRNTKYWKTAVNGAIARASEVWGGRHFLLIPTDGVTIEDKFWELLSAYSPDHLAIFNLTFADLEAASPAEYQATEQEYRKGWVEAGHSTEDFDEWFEGSASSSLLDELTVSDELKEQLLQQLSPFHHSLEVTRLVTGAMGFGYPFTKVSDIISTTTRHIGAVTLPKLVADPTLALLLHSKTGIASEEYCKELNDEHFVTQRLPEAYENLEFLEHVFGRPIRKAGVGVSGWRPEAEYMGSVPFGLSMLHLMQYYRGDLHQPHKEPAVVVLGDTIDDFCFYYSLSRLHEKSFGCRWRGSAVVTALLERFAGFLRLERRLHVAVLSITLCE